MQVNGRCSALLELGSGFAPEFSGRQNVQLNGTILGLSQEEIDEKFDAIHRFSGIGDFIDQPIRTYSTGMVLRLAFAVVAHSNPRILIVDEALAVGDIAFRQRCMRRIHELRVFDGASPLPRNGWQVTANPFPWGIESAFDNNPVTFWKSGDKLQPGMYVQADFTAVQRADSVLIETSPNQPDLHLQLMGETPGGQWKTLAGAPEMSNVAAPDLRREAVQELRRRGIGYVLLFDADVAAADFRAYTARWGVREIGQSNGARLYQLQ